MGEITVGFLTVIKAELDALAAVFDAAGAPPTRLPRDYDTVYIAARLRNHVMGRDLRIVVACIGSAGNPDSSAAATELISLYQPHLLVLSGIAAGLAGKTRIGEVVVSERVVAYEGAAVIAQDEVAPRLEPRPEMGALALSELQSLLHYELDAARAQSVFTKSGGTFPDPSELQDTSSEELCLVPSIRLQTIASGEKLLRDPRFLLQLKETMHGRIEVGEMEAAGIVAACKRTGTPWVIFRGISDFGNPRKSDDFHDYAARMAATVAVDFLQYGYESPTGARPRDLAIASAGRSNNRTTASAPNPLTSLIEDTFQEDSHEAARQILGSRTPLVAFLSVSASNAETAGSQMRYHLGHACFAQLFSVIVDVHPMPGLLISPSIVYAEWRTPQFNRCVYDVCGRWLNAFDDRILPQVVTEAIYTQPISDEPFSTALEWLNEAAPRQRVVAASTLRVLERWRFGVAPPNEDVALVIRGLDLPRPVDLSPPEVLSLGYVLTTAPSWYSAEWMVRTLRALCRSDDASIAQRFFNTSGMAILESSKNRVVWESIAALAKIFDIEGFPTILLTRTLPNVRLDGPMRSRDPGGCIPLHGDLDASLSTVSVPFLSHVTPFVPTMNAGAESSELRAQVLAFARTWQRRLQQGPRRNA